MPSSVARRRVPGQGHGKLQVVTRESIPCSHNFQSRRVRERVLWAGSDKCGSPEAAMWRAGALGRPGVASTHVATRSALHGMAAAVLFTPAFFVLAILTARGIEASISP